MKKIKYIIVIITTFLVIQSCENAIDIEQPGTLLAENAFTNVADLNAGLLGIYALLDNTTQMRFNALFTDEVAIGAQNGGQGITEYSLVLPATDGTALTLWSFESINLTHVNRLINAFGIVTPEADEVALYDEIRGQTYAIRAYMHLNMQTYFSTDLTDDNALGALVLDYIPEFEDRLFRNTNAEVFNLISADLTTASGLLPATTDNTFINKDFITAMRARMNAYRGRYTEANTYATELLSRYPIANQTQYFDMYTDTNNTEVIFKMERNPNDDYSGQGTGGGGTAGSLFAFINSTSTGGPFLEMSRSLYNILDDNDIRKSRYVDPSSTPDPNYLTNPNYINDDVLLIRKFPGSEGINLMNDLKIFRAAEMLLIKAEALADAGDLNGAATLIKQLRDARFGSAQTLPSYANQTEAFGDILDERRIEFAFEGHRWVDLKRLGVRGNREIDRDVRDCQVTAACFLDATDHRFTLPIPLVDIDVDPNLEQNPGY